MQYARLKRRSTPARLHGAISQNTVIYISFILFVVYLTTLSVVCRIFDEEERINRNMEGRSRGLIKDRTSVFSWKDWEKPQK
jgi:hypothetical protein